MTVIYHNPRCGKSRDTLAILIEKGEDVQIVEYLKEVPTSEQLSEILALLGIAAEELIRKGETAYKENFKGKNLTEEEWISAMVAYPKLIERPIVVKNGKAAIGRPPENVLAIL
ncbi:MAG: arsenate reductase [Cyclobacteriaceae bacterium]|jgi:arsenate reductase